MSTCDYWPFCVGGGRYCHDVCIDPMPTDDWEPLDDDPGLDNFDGFGLAS